jgi:RecB family endonuclease NucS
MNSKTQIPFQQSIKQKEHAENYILYSENNMKKNVFERPQIISPQIITPSIHKYGLNIKN